MATMKPRNKSNKIIVSAFFIYFPFFEQCPKSGAARAWIPLNLLFRRPEHLFVQTLKSFQSAKSFGYAVFKRMI